MDSAFKASQLLNTPRPRPNKTILKETAVWSPIGQADMPVISRRSLRNVNRRSVSIAAEFFLDSAQKTLFDDTTFVGVTTPNEAPSDDFVMITSHDIAVDSVAGNIIDHIIDVDKVHDTDSESDFVVVVYE